MIFRLFKFQKNIGHIFFDDMDTDLLKPFASKGIRVELMLDEHSSNDMPVVDWVTLEENKDTTHPSNKTRGL